MLNRLEAVIDRVPSGTRRLIIALGVLALLAFLFPLSDTNRQPLPPPTFTALPNAGATAAARVTPSPAPTRPSATPRPSPTPCVPPDEWVIYTVRSGDTLDAIARLVEIPVAELIESNCLANPNALRVGQQVRVPALPSQFVTATMTPSATLTPSITPAASG